MYLDSSLAIRHAATLFVHVPTNNYVQVIGKDLDHPSGKRFSVFDKVYKVHLCDETVDPTGWVDIKIQGSLFHFHVDGNTCTQNKVHFSAGPPDPSDTVNYK